MAEEVVSQTFEKFLTLLPTIKAGNLSGWPFVVARNVIARRLGKTEANVRVTVMRQRRSEEKLPKSPWLKGRYGR